MKSTPLHLKDFPKLSTWNEEHLNKALEHFAKTANPSKAEITQEDKQWAATMLEMDLQAQNGAIWETENEEDLQTKRTLETLKKMREENIPWTESYPGELYPIETQED